MDAPEDKLCSNWYPPPSEKSISPSVYELHILHCHRRLFKCEVCSKMLQLADQPAHMADHNRTKRCEHCKEDCLIREMDKHVRECPMRPQSCHYCEAHFSIVDLIEHSIECGARTDKCPSCEQLVKLSDMTDHLTVCLSVSAVSDLEETPKKRKRLRRTGERSPNKRAKREK